MPTIPSSPAAPSMLVQLIRAENDRTRADEQEYRRMLHTARARLNDLGDTDLATKMFNIFWNICDMQPKDPSSLASVHASRSSKMEALESLRETSGPPYAHALIVIFRHMFTVAREIVWYGGEMLLSNVRMAESEASAPPSPAAPKPTIMPPPADPKPTIMPSPAAPKPTILSPPSVSGAPVDSKPPASAPSPAAHDVFGSLEQADDHDRIKEIFLDYSQRLARGEDGPDSVFQIHEELAHWLAWDENGVELLEPAGEDLDP